MALSGTCVERSVCAERSSSLSARISEVQSAVAELDRRLDGMESLPVLLSALSSRLDKIETGRRANGVAWWGFAGTVIAALLAAITVLIK